ncbi:hypothetical protein DFH08DRAFT_841545 [Mycena albidolilacea]|uniref:NACHT domain-containing protein n=1 Tax=Mycena albidolilacea TaxID=1033008 RepID=A0AAD7AM95_9AGAR|nr:hypothetical protein DFH08DRAFT_841545 [Mycena albidolilacea]
MAETVGSVASIIQLVDTALKAKDYIQDFIYAPQEQLKLLSEMADLRPLVQELHNRVEANASSEILQRMKNPLEDFKATMERFTAKLCSGNGPLSKFSKRLTWTMWSKKEAQEYLRKFERFKSLLNSWLLVDLCDMGQHYQRDSDKQFKDLAEQRDRDHKAVTGSLDKVNTGISEQQELINSMELSVNNVANKIDVINTRVLHISDDQKRERDQRKRMQIIDWLAPINFCIRHADISRARQAGTGEWLLVDPLFKRWESGSARTLWCHGIPGAGKTVLASKVVDHLTTGSETKNVGVACLYLNHKEVDAQTPVNLLSGLWRQLVFGRDVGPVAKQLYRLHHEKRTTPSMKEVVDLLHSCFTEFSKVYIIVDALDEHPEDQRWILLQHLATMGPTVNVMIMSRPNITPATSHPNLDAIKIHANADDLRKYVDTQIQRSPRFLTHLRTQPELRDEIHTKISETADGMFLLAKLHLESLMAKPTIKAVREALKRLPKGLNDTYDIVMQRIDSQSEEDRNVAHSALTWVVNAKRPLTVEEVQTALAIEPNTQQLDKDNLMDIELILAACAGLVILDGQRSVVRLVHYTTQEYLDSIQTEQFPDAQMEITRTLLTFLAFDGLPDSSWNIRKLPPLVEYSQYCLLHAIGKPEVQLQNMILEFLGCAPQWRQAMLWRWNTPPWDFMDWPLQPSALWIAAAADLAETSKCLLEEAQMTKCSASSALWIASYYGHLAIVQLLLENGVDMNTPTEQYGPPLTAASEAGHHTIVRWLLQNGADTNARGGEYGCALHTALANKQEKIAYLLIEHGADVNLQTWHGAALTTASWYGMENIVVLLVERGADINVKGGRYNFALHTALANKQEKIACLLIEHGADVNLQGEHGAALTTAAWYGSERIVGLLLERGADVNMPGQFALHAALTEGHRKIVRLLIENGANVNVLDKNLCCPLELAADLGDENLFRLLIDTGADPNAHGGMVLL